MKNFKEELTEMLKYVVEQDKKEHNIVSEDLVRFVKNMIEHHTAEPAVGKFEGIENYIRENLKSFEYGDNEHISYAGYNIPSALDEYGIKVCNDINEYYSYLTNAIGQTIFSVYCAEYWDNEKETYINIPFKTFYGLGKLVQCEDSTDLMLIVDEWLTEEEAISCIYTNPPVLNN